MSTDQMSAESSNLVNAEAAKLFADFFNVMPKDAKREFGEKYGGRVMNFMVANGYRFVFGRWYLQAAPEKSAVAAMIEREAAILAEREAQAKRIAALESALNMVLPYAEHADNCGDADAYNNASAPSCGCGLDSAVDQAHAAIDAARAEAGDV